MAARRLLILMLILLGVSTLAAALVPTPGGDDGESEETERESTGAIGAETRPEGGAAAQPKAGKPRERGKSLDASIKLGGGKIPVVPIKVGDNLSLEIRSKRRGLLEIPALGRVEAIAPGTSAFFDIRGREPASYGIRFLGGEKVVARVEVERRRSARKREDEDES
jgi:hypothetical protein